MTRTRAATEARSTDPAGTPTGADPRARTAARPGPAEVVADAVTLTVRSLRRSARSVDALVTAVALPVAILLAFVFVFGGALATPGEYVDYVVPGVLVLSAAFGAAATAVDVNVDATSGFVDRLRSMPVAASSVLAGHVAAGVARNVVSTGVVVAVALVVGFRPRATVGDWLGVLGLLVLVMLAVAWVGAAVGLLASGPETAGSYSFVVLFVPYVSSALVPTETMPRVLRAVADHQPTTPVVDTVRGLLLGTPLDGSPGAAVAWCAGVALLGVAASAALLRRRWAP